MPVFLGVGRKTAFVILRFWQSFTKVGKVFGGCCVCVFLSLLDCSFLLLFPSGPSCWPIPRKAAPKRTSSRSECYKNRPDLLRNDSRPFFRNFQDPCKIDRNDTFKTILQTAIPHAAKQQAHPRNSLTPSPMPILTLDSGTLPNKAVQLRII